MKIMIYDDHTSVRESYKRWLEGYHHNVVFDSGIISNWFNDIKIHKPDILLIDIDFPENSRAGLDYCKKIMNEFNSIKIVFVSHFSEPEIIIDAIKSGAKGYFTKCDELKSLLEIIEKVSKDQYAFSPTVINSLITLLINLPAGSTKTKRSKIFDSLSKDELFILNLIAAGYSNKEIADKLRTNEKRIKNLISNLLIKLNSKNRAHLVTKAFISGIIKIEDINNTI